jgi:dTMP kinase
MRHNRGFYLTLEGIDGIGKSTQVSLLNKIFLEDSWLKGKVVTNFEPGCSEIGPGVRSLLFDVKQAGVVNLHPVASGLLYLADHIQNQHSKVAPYVAQGYVVVGDRSFIDSQRAYYDGGESDLTYQAHKIIHPECITPDLTILMLLDPEVCLNRAKARGDKKFLAKPWSNVTALTAIEARYRKMAEADKDRFVILELTDAMTQEQIVDQLAETIIHKYYNLTALPFVHD